MVIVWFYFSVIKLIHFCFDTLEVTCLLRYSIKMFGGDEAKMVLEKSFNVLTLFCLHSLLFVEDVNMYCSYRDPSVTLEFRDMLKLDPILVAEDNPFGHLKVLVTFYRNQIFYKYGDTEIWITDSDLVNYIYNIMSRMSALWMHVMLCVLFPDVVASLRDLAKEALYVYKRGNSLMRYHVETGHSLGLQFWSKGRVWDVEEVRELFLKSHHGKGVLSAQTKIDPNNLYSYSLPLHGEYSLLARPEMLAHLLLIEAVMHKDHKWEEIYSDCYHCQVEKFHFYLFREEESRVIEYYIFFDLSIWKWMIPLEVRMPEYPCLNMYVDMHQFEINWRHLFLDNFLYYEFFRTRIPMKVKSLKALGLYASTTAVLMARLEIADSLGLRSFTEEYPERRGLNKFRYMQKMVPVLAYMRDLFNHYNNRNCYVLKGKLRSLPKMHPILLEEILRRASQLPITHHVSILRLNTVFVHHYIKKIKKVLSWSVF